MIIFHIDRQCMMQELHLNGTHVTSALIDQFGGRGAILTLCY